jgi:hypothetical protein
MESFKDSWFKIILMIILAVVVGYFWGKSSILAIPTQYIFDSKTFSDNKIGNFESVYVAGTLTGDDQDGNGTTSITCTKDKMECLVNTIQGISKTSCQLSRLDSPQSFPIVKWDDYVITATDGNPYDTFSCFKTTINIDRKSEVVSWVQEPINQSQMSCKDIKDEKIYKWTIEDPAWMKDFKASVKNKL